MKMLPGDLGFGSSSSEETVSPVAAPENPFGFHKIDDELPVVEENAFDPTEVEAAARASLDFLAALALPLVFKYCFPPVFQAIWTWLLSYVHRIRDFSQLAIGLPRGFGKTMLIKIFVAYCILFTKKKFILVVCGTQTKANNIIKDIMGILSEKNIKTVFGDWQIGVETDRQDLKHFSFRGRRIILMGAGASSDIRGITLDNERPDVMIFDDIQTREDADSEVVSDNLETWLSGTAMKAKSPEGCLFIFIANMYPTKFSLLRRIKTNPTWIKFIAGGIINNNGRVESLWEDLQPLQQLLVEYERDLASGKPEVFFSEVLNDENASVNRFINVDNIPQNPFQGDDQHQGNFILIDPSNDKANSDLVATGYFELFDGKPVLTELHEERLSPSASIELALNICLRKNCRLVVVESTAYQYSYLHWFDRICAERGISGITCVDIYPGGMSKNSRILTMFKGLIGNEPEQYLAAQVRAMVLAQITSFNPLKTNNVDNILDLLTYSVRVFSQYGEFILSGLTIEMMEMSNIPVLSYEDNVSF